MTGRLARSEWRSFIYLTSSWAVEILHFLRPHKLSFSTMAANGYHPTATPRPLKAGIFAPILSFFMADSEDLGLSLALTILPEP